jgi:hypothetical protein
MVTVLFGEKSPIVVVGDNQGIVTAYRVIEPVFITHQGPVQQRDKLKAAILAQSEPSAAQKLQEDESEHLENSQLAGGESSILQP